MAEYLDQEQLLPFLVVEEHRRRAQQRGQTILITPWPPCPTCEGRIDQLTLADDFPTLDRIMTAHPCGHTHRIASDDLQGVDDWAYRQVDAEENRALTESPPPPSRDANIAIHLGSTLPDGGIQQTQIGTVTVSLGPNGIEPAEFNRSLGDLLIAAGEHLRRVDIPKVV